jgi:hypothetical protein
MASRNLVGVEYVLLSGVRYAEEKQCNDLGVRAVDLGDVGIIGFCRIISLHMEGSLNCGGTLFVPRRREEAIAKNNAPGDLRFAHRARQRIIFSPTLSTLQISRCPWPRSSRGR